MNEGLLVLVLDPIGARFLSIAEGMYFFCRSHTEELLESITASDRQYY